MGRLLEIADSNGDYPLHLCVLENLLDMMVTLLREGADPLMVNTRGETPLTVAVDVQAEPEMVQILEQAEQEARAQSVELKAAELEAEAEVLLEQGDANAAKEKWRAAAELYAQIEARDEEQACRDKIKDLPASAASTPKSAGGGGPAAGQGADDAAVPSSFSKLKKRLLGSEPAHSAVGRVPPKALAALPGGLDDEDELDSQQSAADMQVTQALEQLSRMSEDKDRDLTRPASGGSLQRGKVLGAAGQQRRDVDASGKSGTWVGDVFYSDDEEGDEDDSPPPPPPPAARGFSAAAAVPEEEEEEEEEFEEEAEMEADHGELLVQHVMAQAGFEAQPSAKGQATGSANSGMRRGGLLRQLQGLGQADNSPKPAPAPASPAAPCAATPAEIKRQASPLSQPSPVPAIGRSPSQLRADRTRAAARTQQKFSREWGGEWGAYRDSEFVGKLNASQTVEALLKVLQSQKRLLVVADGLFAEGSSAVNKLQLGVTPHL